MSTEARARDEIWSSEVTILTGAGRSAAVSRRRVSTVTS